MHTCLCGKSKRLTGGKRHTTLSKMGGGGGTEQQGASLCEVKADKKDNILKRRNLYCFKIYI